MAFPHRPDAPELPDFSMLKRLARDQLIYLLEQVSARRAGGLCCAHWTRGSSWLTPLELVLSWPFVLSLELLGQARNEAPGRKTWDLARVHGTHLFPIEARDTALVTGITGRERWLRHLLGSPHSRRSRMKHEWPHTAYPVVRE